MKGNIYVCDRDGEVQAVLAATDSKSKEYFFSLNHFSILFLQHHDLDDAVAGKDNIRPACSERYVSEDSAENGKVGMFVIMNKEKDLFYISSY